MPKNMVGVRKAARECGVGEPTFLGWVKAGQAPQPLADPVTGRERYSILAIREWLKSVGRSDLGKAS